MNKLTLEDVHKNPHLEHKFLMRGITEFLKELTESNGSTLSALTRNIAIAGGIDPDQGAPDAVRKSLNKLEERLNEYVDSDTIPGSIYVSHAIYPLTEIAPTMSEAVTLAIKKGAKYFGYEIDDTSRFSTFGYTDDEKYDIAIAIVDQLDEIPIADISSYIIQRLMYRGAEYKHPRATYPMVCDIYERAMRENDLDVSKVEILIKATGLSVREGVIANTIRGIMSPPDDLLTMLAVVLKIPIDTLKKGYSTSRQLKA